MGTQDPENKYERLGGIFSKSFHLFWIDFTNDGIACHGISGTDVTHQGCYSEDYNPNDLERVKDLCYGLID